MAKVLLVSGKFISFLDNGDENNGGSVLTYEVGTTTPKTTYSDTALSVANANPVVLDSAGRATILYNGDIKLIVRDSSGNTIYTQDGATPQSVTTQTVLSTNTTLTSTHADSIIECTAAITLSLTSASTLGNTWSVEVYNSSAGNITISRLNAGDTINGAASDLTLTAYNSTRIHVNNAATGFVIPTNFAVLGSNNTFTGVNTFNGASPFIFEGATADAYETTLAITDPTADRTVTVQNQTGTLSLCEPIVGESKGLTLKNNATNPNYQLDLAATAIVLHDSSSNALQLQTWSVTIDITASGANGLDTGAEGSSTWYYVWAIYDGTNKRGLLSASSTSPTMPSGYTYKALIGAVYNNGSSNFLAFHQVDNEIFYKAGQSVLSSGTATTDTAITITGVVPSVAKKYRFQFDATNAGATDRLVYFGFIASTDAITVRCGGTTTGAQDNSAQIEFPNVSQGLYYHWSTVSSSSVNVYMNGFTI